MPLAGSHTPIRLFLERPPGAVTSIDPSRLNPSAAASESHPWTSGPLSGEAVAKVRRTLPVFGSSTATRPSAPRHASHRGDEACVEQSLSGRWRRTLPVAESSTTSRSAEIDVIEPPSGPYAIEGALPRWTGHEEAVAASG